MSYERPFEGLRAVDLSQGIAGPYCGSLLALHGAEVIKIEPPEGDWSRRLGERIGDQSALAICGNRGKRSIALDLKREEAKAIALDLARRADVLIEGFRPGVMDRLGLGYEAVRIDNPRILYLSVSGYGQRGPLREQPCTDTVVQAFSGLMSINVGADGIPHRVGFPVADMVTALYAFQALATAIHARAGETVGRHLDVSLIQSAAAIQSGAITEHVLSGGAPKVLNAPAGAYRTADGWLAITLVTEAQFVAMCEAMELAELPADPRFADFQSRAAHLDALVPVIQARLRERDTAAWCARFDAAGALAQPVHDHGQWLEHAHVRAIDAAPRVAQPDVGDVPMPRIPGMAPIAADDPRAVAPHIGEHAREILEAYGRDAESIERLAETGVVRIPALGSG
ncbi:MAG: CoA transferase [Gammaproteobacteria bacterium]|nr:CoA transferase [Gammaproteobacteria bacterium]